MPAKFRGEFGVPKSGASKPKYRDPKVAIPSLNGVKPCKNDAAGDAIEPPVCFAISRVAGVVLKRRESK